LDFEEQGCHIPAFEKKSKCAGQTDCFPDALSFGAEQSKCWMFDCFWSPLKAGSTFSRYRSGGS
jgi:hypothetical protein